MNQDDALSIPEALSHRQLNQWLGTAVQEFSTSADEVDDTFSPELERWANHSRFLLQRMARERDAIGSHRSPQQLMALGSFRTHLMLGLQALMASQPGDS